MPTHDGRLTEEELAKAVDWLNKQWKPGKCPFCGQETWEVLDHLLTPVRFTPGGGIALGGVTLPSLPIVCTTCGYTAFMNAIVMGILSPQKTPETEKAAEEENV